MIEWNCANRTQIAIRAGLAPSPEHTAGGDFQPPRRSVDESREVS